MVTQEFRPRRGDLLSKLNEHGIRGMPVGGCVRDMFFFRGREPGDWILPPAYPLEQGKGGIPAYQDTGHTAILNRGLVMMGKGV